MVSLWIFLFSGFSDMLAKKGEQLLMSNNCLFYLSNGITIPAPGYGTWRVDNESAKSGVLQALQAGYRHIDTAAAYGNEKGVGEAIRQSGLSRSKIFVTSKCWNDHRGRENVKKACQESLDKLGLDYLDLYLLHWPANAVQYEDWDALNQDSWQGMIDLYKEGKVRAIGVSNFKTEHLASLLDSEIKPMVNQIEIHPGWSQSDLVDLCHREGIAVEAWSPLGSGRVLNDPTIVEIAERNGITPAQVCLSHTLQKGILPLPKSVTHERIVSNLRCGGITLSPQDLAAIDALEPLGFSGSDPATVTF